MTIENDQMSEQFVQNDVQWYEMNVPLVFCFSYSLCDHRLVLLLASIGGALPAENDQTPHRK